MLILVLVRQKTTTLSFDKNGPVIEQRQDANFCFNYRFDPDPDPEPHIECSGSNTRGVETRD